MREIKFRAWDRNYNRFVYTDWNSFRNWYNEEKGGKVVCPRGSSYEKDYLSKPMQLVGIPDKNGKEIYEGDILQIKTQSGRVEMFTCEYGIHKRWMASGWEVQIPGFAFVDSTKHPTFPILENYLNGNDLDIIEVIGNIYENSNLLTP